MPPKRKGNNNQSPARAQANNTNDNSRAGAGSPLSRTPTTATFPTGNGGYPGALPSPDGAQGRGNTYGESPEEEDNGPGLGAVASSLISGWWGSKSSTPAPKPTGQHAKFPESRGRQVEPPREQPLARTAALNAAAGLSSQHPPPQTPTSPRGFEQQQQPPQQQQLPQTRPTPVPEEKPARPTETPRIVTPEPPPKTNDKDDRPTTDTPDTPKASGGKALPDPEVNEAKEVVKERSRAPAAADPAPSPRGLPKPPSVVPDKPRTPDPPAAKAEPKPEVVEDPPVMKPEVIVSPPVVVKPEVVVVPPPEEVDDNRPLAQIAPTRANGRRSAADRLAINTLATYVSEMGTPAPETRTAVERELQDSELRPVFDALQPVERKLHAFESIVQQVLQQAGQAGEKVSPMEVLHDVQRSLTQLLADVSATQESTALVRARFDRAEELQKSGVRELSKLVKDQSAELHEDVKTNLNALDSSVKLGFGNLGKMMKELKDTRSAETDARIAKLEADNKQLEGLNIKLKQMLVDATSSISGTNRILENAHKGQPLRTGASDAKPPPTSSLLDLCQETRNNAITLAKQNAAQLAKAALAASQPKVDPTPVATPVQPVIVEPPTPVKVVTPPPKPSPTLAKPALSPALSRKPSTSPLPSPRSPGFYDAEPDIEWSQSMQHATAFVIACIQRGRYSLEEWKDSATESELAPEVTAKIEDVGAELLKIANEIQFAKQRYSKLRAEYDRERGRNRFKPPVLVGLFDLSGRCS